ncbi:lactococcin 972 family bacteriocin, partial [Paenibacillus sp. TAF58]
INLDPIKTENVSIPGVRVITEQSPKTFIALNGSLGEPSYAVDAGGGKFWVDLAVFVDSYYNHPTLEHKSSATNSNTTVSSAWEQSFTIAHARVASTLSGNKANWNTR